MTVKPFAHQTEVIELAKKGNVALFHDCGVGKTYSALQIIKHWRHKGPALVLCPKRLIHSAWIEDAATFTPDLDIVALYHTNPEKRLAILREDHEVFVTTPETFKNMFHHIKDRGFKTLIVDESSKMKDFKSQTTRSILTLAGFTFRKSGGVSFGKVDDVIPHRHALTATPAPNSPEEYWGQIKLGTGPGNAIFSDNPFTFRSRYFAPIDYGQHRKGWVFRNSTYEEFCHKLAQACHVTRKSILNLPGQIEYNIDVELSEREQKAYKDMKDDAVYRINNKTVLAVNVLSEIMKLRQITSGFIYDEEGIAQGVGDSKIRGLKELYAGYDYDTQSIIWINFKQEEAMVRKVLPDHVVLDGSLKEQNKKIKAFKDGNVQFLIANQASVSHGLTFVNCNEATYFSQNYSYELMKQSMDRIHRIGQTRPCYYNHLIARDSIDGIVRAATKKKELIVNAFLEYILSIQNGETMDSEASKDIFKQSHTQILKSMACESLGVRA